MTRSPEEVRGLSLGEVRGPRPGRVRELLAITLVLAACSLVYELLIAQALSLLAGNTVVWYSLTVGLYLGAMGVGAAVSNKRTGRSRWDDLFAVEVLLSGLGAIAVLLIQVAHYIYVFYAATPEGASVVGFFGVSLMMIFMVGLLSGVELPLLIQVGNELSGGKKITNRVLGWDYIGALVAGAVFPLVLLPNLSLAVIGFVTALANLLVAAYVLHRFVPDPLRLGLKMALVAAVATVVGVGVSQGGAIQQYFLKRYYFSVEAERSAGLFGSLRELPNVFRAQSPYQKIDLIYHPSESNTDLLLPSFSFKYEKYPDSQRSQFLYLNGDFQLSSSHEELYHEWFAHIPIILADESPERVLVLGGGDGLLIRELLKHDRVRSITHVDLDRTLVELARTHPTFTAMNRGALDDPRVRTQYGDAYQYIRKSTETFDAIYMDFPYVKDYDVAKLLSREFFHFVREHLDEGGFAVFDAPGQNYFSRPDQNGDLRLVPGGEWPVYYNTIRAAGFESVVPFTTELDADNPRAVEFLESWEGTPSFLDPETGEPREVIRRAWISQVVAQHVTYFNESFILMWKDDRDPEALEYRDLGIELLMLNEKRFGLAFPGPFSREAAIDAASVNSILRPKLPVTGVWRIRRPGY